jgi:hypothetical protein
MYALDNSVNPPQCKLNTVTSCARSHPTDSAKCTKCIDNFSLDGYDTATATSFGTSCKAMGTTNCLAFAGATCKLCVTNNSLKSDNSGC